MNLLEAALRRIIADLEHAHADWAIVGGLAVSARAEPRTTRDVDVVVAVRTDAEAESLVRSLHATGYRVQAIVEHESAGRLATARCHGRAAAAIQHRDSARNANVLFFHALSCDVESPTHPGYPHRRPLSG